MGRIAFVGPSYESQSPVADWERTQNLYVEVIESGQGKSAAALYSGPGLALFSSLVAGTPLGGVRGSQEVNGRAFFLAGNFLWETDQFGNPSNRGFCGNDGLPTKIVTNGINQLFFAVGGVAYTFDLVGLNGVRAVAQLATIQVADVDFMDGFFVALQSNSKNYYVSAPEDATTWNLSNVGIVSVFPDNVLAMLVDHRQLFLWGNKHGVAYYDSGNNLFPFDVVPGSFMEMGSMGLAGAKVKLDNTIYWVGQDERGFGMGWKLTGYTAQRVTNFAVERQWQSYVKQFGTISDVTGYSFQDQGHSFWHVFFPSANQSWRYDVSAGMWYNMSFRAAGTNVDTAHRSQCYISCFGKHLVGDWASGNVYEMNTIIPNGAGGWLFADDFGNPIRRVRRSPMIAKENEWLFHEELQIDLEAGLGPIPPLLDGMGNPRDPQITLRWTDDGGKTWSNERTMVCGQAGNGKQRAYARRLGRSRGRIYEICMTDPIPWRIVDAYLRTDPDFQPVERISKSLGKMA